MPTPPILLLVAAMAFTGANVPFGKSLIGSFPLYDILFLRFAIATAVLSVIAGPRGWKRVFAMPPAALGAVLALAGVGSVLFSIFLLEGTRLTAAVDAGIITATLPAVVAILSIVVLGARLSRSAMACVGLAALGLIIMQTSSSGDHAVIRSWVGNALVVCAVVCEATFVLVSRSISKVLSPIDLSLAVSATSAAMCLPLMLFDQATAGSTAAGPDAWALLVWYALSASVFCTMLWYAGVGHVPSWQAGLATTALPVTAMAVAVVVLGEPLLTAQLIGAVLVIAAIVAGALLSPPPHQPGGRAATDRRLHRRE